ncbi:hypothetical protein [Sphingobacterium haloxyli]|nr:hypothetical protein [Sphingobacterium haloxyli]
MKSFLLPAFLLLLLMRTSYLVRGQDFESAYIDLLKNELQALPYKDLNVPYSLSYDSSQMGYVFQAPQLFLDSALRTRIDRNVNALPRTTGASYKGTIRFDDYTNAIFIRSEVVGAALLINGMHVMAEPRGGMTRFMKRWGGFLDSLKRIDKFEDKNIGLDSFVYMIVEVNGSLVCGDTSEAGQLLQQFIRGEKPWGPGIMSGRPLVQHVALQIPSYGMNYDKLRYKQHGGLRTRILINGEEKIVCFSYELPREQDVRTILSVAYENRRYVAPVFHKGPVNELEQLVTFLRGEQIDISYYNPYMANRVYFYIIDD